MLILSVEIYKPLQWALVASLVSGCTTPNTPAPVDPVSATATAQVENVLLDPGARATAMMATAQSVEAVGEAGLEQDGYPLEALKSQKDLSVFYSVNASVNGSEITEVVKSQLASTLIDMEGTDMGGYFVLASAGHGFSRDSLDADILSYLKSEYGTENVQINSVKIDEINVNEQVILNAGEFGVDARGDILEDSAFIAFRKDNLTPEALIELQGESMKADKISFKEPDGNTNAFGYCRTSDTGFRPVASINIKFSGYAFARARFKPFLIGNGCSGAMLGEIYADGSWTNLGIIVADNRNQQGQNTDALVSLYSGMGEENFLNRTKRASESVGIITVLPTPIQ